MAKTKQFAIVVAVMALLKLDEAGKVSTFFNKEVKRLKREIQQLKSNLKAEALQYEIECEMYDDNIQDLTEALMEARSNVIMDNVSSNANMASFSGTYWERVNSAKYDLNNKEETLVKFKECYTENVEAAEEQISDIEDNIAWIVG